jgi:hypothetical protein
MVEGVEGVEGVLLWDLITIRPLSSLQEEEVAREFRPTRIVLGVLVPQETTDKLRAEEIQTQEVQGGLTVEVGMLINQVGVGVVLREMVDQRTLVFLRTSSVAKVVIAI